MANFKQAKKKIGNTTYTAQFSGLSAALRAVDNSYVDGTSNTSLEKLTKYLFENVIVEPKNLTPDDFTDMDEFNEVVAFAREVMQGTYFRDNKVEEPTDKGSKG